MSFLFEETPFDMFGTEHLMAILFFAVIGIVSIIYANKNLNEHQKTQLGIALAWIPLAAVLIRMCLMLYLGKFDIAKDLPLYLCRIICFIALFAIAKRNRYWLGVIYFWILAGTLNATITPDLHNGFPHYDYLIYFPNHAGLVVLALYIPLVYKIDITLKDLWNAFLMINIYLVSIHLLNWILDANYMYTMAKPPVASLMDYLGPWPWYLVSGQLMGLAFFFLAYLPFGIRRFFKATK